MVSKKKKKKKIKRIKFKNIAITFLTCYLFYYLIFAVFDMKISNIYISGGNYLSDQEIIDIAKIDNYPGVLTNNPNVIKKRLIKSDYIQNARVTLKPLSKIHIKIEEDTPLYYDEISGKTILKSGKKMDIKPQIISARINKEHEKVFLKKMNMLSDTTLQYISEIKYEPDGKDEGRYLITMTDNNYVYVTLLKFEEIDNYIDYVEKFNGQKGVLYLNSGGYFKILP